MNVYFLWKHIETHGAPLTEEIEIIEGSDWWIENNQSLDITHIEKMDETFVCMIAKKMPEDWTGSHTIPLKQTAMKYKVVKEDDSFKWDIVGEWNRILVKNSNSSSVKNLQQLFEGSVKFTTL